VKIMDKQQVLADLEKLKTARELLMDVHFQVGGYGHGKIYPETIKAINEFFGFDDSRDID
jgi:hypothetical protein